MASIEASKLSEILTIEDIKKIYISLGGTIKSETSEKWVCSTICHNRETINISFKLEFYTSSKRFHCYTGCSETFNIYQLVMKRKKLLGEICNFPQSLQYCCDVCGIPYDKTQRVTKKVIIDDWQKDLGKFLKNKSIYNPLQIYDDSILNFFDNKYHESWLNEGLSAEAMDMFDVKWYAYKSQIVLPVRDVNNNLIGIRVRNQHPDDLEQGKKYVPLMLANGMQYRFPTNQVLYGLNVVSESVRRHRRIIIGESEKAVIKLYGWFKDDSICVATLGSSLGKLRRDMIIELGITEVILLSDKDYKVMYDDDYNKWYEKQKKLALQFKGFCDVSIIWDSQDNRLGYKQNASDYNKATFDEMYENRDKINWEELE